MKKNISVPMETFAGLVSAARALPPPKDYYQGRRHGGAELPDNILLFHRKERFGRGEDRYFHHRHVLVMALRGTGRVVVDGRTFGLHPGRCVLIEPYQFHHFGHFAEEGIDWFFATFEWARPEKPGTVFHPGAGFWEEAGRFLAEYGRGRQAGGGDRLALRLALLLTHLREAPAVRAGVRGGAGDAGGLLVRVHEIVRQNMRRLVSIDEIARRLGMSASHLRARFRAAAGRSLGEFQREVRLQKAAEMLVGSAVSVGEVAEACGWATPFAFSRAFDRYWGRSPKRFALFSRDGTARRKRGVKHPTSKTRRRTRALKTAFNA